MNRLQQLRLDALLTAEDLAGQVGVSAKTIYNLEAGKGARITTLKALATHFKVPASTLLLPAVSHSQKEAA